eukprot:6797537-Prymnesium_polylepis.1
MCHASSIGSGPLNRRLTSAPSPGAPPAASSKMASSPSKASPPGAASGAPRAAAETLTLCAREHDLVQALKSLKRGRAEDA